LLRVGGTSNERESQQSYTKTFKNDRYNEEISNLINMWFGNDNKLVSSIEKMEHNFYKNGVSVISPNNLILEIKTSIKLEQIQHHLRSNC
jgi:hypothetical protein